MAASDRTPDELHWRKSSYSNGGDPQCVEVADDGPDAVLLRDSKNPSGGVLRMPRSALHALIPKTNSAD